MIEGVTRNLRQQNPVLHLKVTGFCYDGAAWDLECDVTDCS